MKIALPNGAWTKKGEVIEIDSVATAERIIESIQDACVADPEEQIDHSEDIMRFRPLLNAERGVEREPEQGLNAWADRCASCDHLRLKHVPGCNDCLVSKTVCKGNFDGVNMNEVMLHDAKPDTSPEASLSLLVCDFGKWCALQLESGEFHWGLHNGENLMDNGYGILRFPFNEVKDSISKHFDALDTPPIPRIEYVGGSGGGDGPWRHRLFLTSTDDFTGLMDADVKALCQLAGHPLPIYSPKIGTWTQIGKHWRDCPVELWRYRK